MTGSYAGAMGQTQFMPDSFLKYAVDYSGTGRRDIWNDLGCVFASTANYLAREGWQRGAAVGRAGRAAAPASIRRWPGARTAARSANGRGSACAAGGRLPVPAATLAAVILPGGPGSEAFLAYHPNFLAIRRYNPSDFYCISVGLIGDLVTA